METTVRPTRRGLLRPGGRPPVGPDAGAAAGGPDGGEPGSGRSTLDSGHHREARWPVGGPTGEDVLYLPAEDPATVGEAGGTSKRGAGASGRGGKGAGGRRVRA